MKIQEFRDRINNCKREDLEKIASELYKMLPKSKKESEADQLIENIISGVGSSSSEKKPKAAGLDFNNLRRQITEFLENVDAGYYFSPNRIVSKDKRSKWRFEVKNYVKAINTIPENGENADEAAKLLREIYKRLSYGCGYYTFSSEDPFKAIGITQPDFYDMLVKRTFATGFTDENLKNMLEDAALVYLDRDTLQINLEAIYVKSLATSDLKYKSLEIIKEYVSSYEEKLKAEKKNSDNRFQLENNIEEMCETMLIISIFLCEPDAAVKYYWKHVKNYEKEIVLYRILDTIDQFGDDKLWLSVYEDGLKKKIKPRASLEKHFHELKNSMS